MGCEKGVKVNAKVFGLNNWRMKLSSSKMGRPVAGAYYEEKKRAWFQTCSIKMSIKHPSSVGS